MSDSSAEPAAEAGPVARALSWIRSHRAQGGGMVVSSRDRTLYPEVTGYLVPTLLRHGEQETALAFARRLVAAQRPDGSFTDPAGRASYAFDTGQVIRGFAAALPFAPELEEPLARACRWLVSSSSPEGRLAVPTAAEWSLGRRGTISEAVHLYALPGLLQASDLLGERAWRVFTAKSIDWYAKNVELAEFDRPNQLTHLYGYVMEALIELGAAELAAIGMKAVAERMTDAGLVPAYHDVPWCCSPGQMQSAIVWAKLGDRLRAERALSFLRKFRNGTGGYFGSYGPGADYFAADEPSWTAKFELDAEAALADLAKTSAKPQAAKKPETVTVKPQGTERNLDAAAWHEAIVGEETPATVAARVANGASPIWVRPILAATKPGDSVLELGSGTGELSAVLARNGRKVTCLDFSAESLAFAGRVFDLAKAEGDAVQADVTAPLPFADGAFDVVWSSGLLEHFPSETQQKILAESLRVARRAVIALVPNASSLPYRIGKSLQERAGVWSWGKEDPIATLRPAFLQAGAASVTESTLAPEHATEFLNGTTAEGLKAPIKAWLASLTESERDGLGQGYLLVSVAEKRRTAAPKRVLAIVPNDPLEAYAEAGYPDLTGYFNPGGAFDEVVCLSPHEKSAGSRYGVKIVPTAPKDFARACAEHQVGVIRAYDLPSAALVAAHRPQGVPFVVSVHDVDPSRLPAVLPEADLWLPVSRACGDLLRSRGADPAKIVPFSNRIDPQVFHPVASAGEQAAFDALFPGRIRILCVGRHSRQKNQDGVVRALAKLGPNYVGVFVGKGEVARTRQLAQELGVADRCRFIASVPNAELAAWYRSAEVMCTPSRWEGFGVVFAEAAACGAAIVSTDRAPMNEFLTHGETALLVADPESSDGIANAIRAAAARGRQRDLLRRNAPNAARPFAKEAVDAAEVAAYERVFPRNRGRDAVARTVANTRAPVAAAAVEAAPSLTPHTAHTAHTATTATKATKATAAAATRPSHAAEVGAATFKVHLLTPDMAGEWERVVLASPDAWLYHTIDEQALLAEAWGGESLSFLIETKGRIVGVVPLQRWPWDRRTLWSTLMGPAGPALTRDLDSGEREEALAFAHGVIGQMVTLKKAASVRMILPPLAPSARAAWAKQENPLLKHGYRDASTRTSVVDLVRSEEEIFAGFCAPYRNRIRKAERDGVIVVPANGTADVDAYYALHVETYERTGVKPHPRAYFESIFRRFLSTGRSDILFAMKDGRPISALNVATFGDAALYWTGANSAEGLAAGAAKLLQWTGMRRAKARGAVVYEVGEVFDEATPETKESGLTSFKSRFGGTSVPFWKGILGV